MGIGRRRASGLGWFVGLSVAVHVVIFAAAIGAGRLASGTPPPPQNVMITKLVRLGEERPPQLLPRKEQPPPPAPPPATPVAPKVEPAPATTAPPPPPPKESVPSAADRAKELSRLSSALERLKKRDEAPPEGHPDGVPEGEATSLSQAMAGNKYLTEVYACIKSNYAIEGVDPRNVQNRSAEVVVRIDADGRFLEHHIERSSQLDAFDRAVDRAVIRCGQVSPPPAEIRDLVLAGLVVEFRP